MTLDELRTALQDRVEFVVGEASRDATGATIDGGGVTFRARSGALVEARVVAGAASARVGWVFVGDGEADVRFPDVHAARRFANRQVLLLGGARARFAPVAAGGAFRTAVDAALFFGAFVFDDRPAVGEAPRAEEVLRQRIAQIDLAGLWVASDALLGEDTGRAWIDVRTADRYGVVRDARVPGDAPEDRWLTAIHDPTGAFPDEGRCGALGVYGRDRLQGVHAHVYGWTRCDAPPVEVVRTDVRLSAAPKPDGYELVVAGEARLTVRAARATRTLALDVRFLEDDVATVGAVRADGERVDVLRIREPDEPIHTVLLALPAVLAPGEEVTLAVPFADEWRHGTPGSRGRATSPQFPWPRVRGAPDGRSGAIRLRVEVPAGLEIAMSGDERRGEGAGGAWAEVELPDGSPWVGVAVGSWESLREDALPTSSPEQVQPAVDVRLFVEERASAPSLLGFSRTVIRWMNQLLPPFPPSELEVFQAPDQWGGFAWVAPPGLLAMQQARVRYGGTDEVDHLAEGVLAHELAHQVWGNHVAGVSDEDDWISETLAETYSDWFVRAAFGDAAFEERRALHRKACEEDLDRFAGVALAAPERRGVALYECGPYLFGHALTQRIGMEALAGALDDFAFAGGRVRTEELLATLQSRTEVPLADFFGAWVYGGFVPALKGTWTEGDGGITGVVEADVPFGTYDVPVRVIRGGKAETVWVKVVDGRGEWSLPAGPKAKSVDLDPHGLLLARWREMRRR
ncbi:MAG: hypothetical protein ACOZNI_36100 [Myxococcota bacterium]